MRLVGIASVFLSIVFQTWVSASLADSESAPREAPPAQSLKDKPSPTSDLSAAELEKLLEKSSFDPKQIEELYAQIARVEEKLTKTAANIALRLDYLKDLKSLLEKAKKINDSSEKLGEVIGALQLPPPVATDLTIISATHGDLIHHHVCDATGYFIEHCKLKTNTNTVVDVDRCILATAQGSAICGYDPSPQGFKEIYIEYSCGNQKRVYREREAAPVRLICSVPDAPASAQQKSEDKPPPKS